MNTSQQQKSIFLISICGGSATGKSSFLNELRHKFDDDITIISQDDYYKPIEQQFMDEQGVYNFDLPGSIDHEAFLADLLKISAGNAVEKLEYTFNHPDKIPAVKHFKPSKVIIIEGLFVLHHPEVAQMTDYKVFISADEEICYKRRHKRDIHERGIPEEVFMHQWNHHVLPAYRNHVSVYREMCDLIIDNNVSFRDGFETLSSIISNALQT